MIVRHTQPGPEAHGLTSSRMYAVIGIEADHYRILNDFGEPTLFPPEAFEIIDPREPADWLTTLGDEGERYAYPVPLNRPGFFEDYFDRDPATVAAFWQRVNQQLNTAAAG